MRRQICVAFVLTIVLFGVALPAHAATPRVRLDASLTCGPEGGATVRFTISNKGSAVAHLDPDFHLLLEVVRRGRQPGVVLFVFPAPGFDRIPPRDSRTFTLDMGLPEDGVPGVDLSGARLLLEAEVWLQDRAYPVVRTLTFPACS